MLRLGRGRLSYALIDCMSFLLLVQTNTILFADFASISSVTLFWQNSKLTFSKEQSGSLIERGNQNILIRVHDLKP